MGYQVLMFCGLESGINVNLVGSPVPGITKIRLTALLEVIESIFQDVKVNSTGLPYFVRKAFRHLLKCSSIGHGAADKYHFIIWEKAGIADRYEMAPAFSEETNHWMAIVRSGVCKFLLK